MVVKTFRGLLADGGQDRIRLSTIKGKVGYRIAKFEIMSRLPYGAAGEHIVKIYSDEQSTIDAIVNFTDSTLLGVAIINNNTSGYTDQNIPTIIFDREVFNQDIYLTHSDTVGATPANYYLELEVIPLDDAGAEYTTLKDMRS